MKNFLRTASLVMTMVTACSLCACDYFYTDGDYDFFSETVLEDNLVPDLPRIEAEMAEKEYNRKYRFKVRGEEYFNEYVSSVYEYLSSLNFEYFGYRGRELGTFFGGIPTYEFHFGFELSDFKYTENESGQKLENCYVFVWGNVIHPDWHVLYPKYYLEMTYFADRELNVYMDLNFYFDDYHFNETE